MLVDLSRRYLLRSVMLALVFFAVLAFAPPLGHAQSDEEARLKVAEVLIAETVTSNMVENMISALWPPLEADLKAKNPDVTDEALADLKEDLALQQRELIAELIVDMPAVYARYFTTEELQALLAFQTSPVGKKALEVQPQIMAEMMPTMLRSIQQQTPQIMERFKESAREKGFRL